MRRRPASEASASSAREDLRPVARQLEAACRRLATSLAGAEQAVPERTVEALSMHLREARRLRPVLRKASAVLRERPRDGAARPGGRELEDRVQACIALLRQSAEAYGRLIGRASGEMAGLDRQLRQMQRGGQVLRTYRDAIG